MDDVKLISDLIWVKRGIAKRVPEKVKLKPEELRRLLEGGDRETTEQSGSEAEMHGDSSSSDPNEPLKFRKIRGSNPEENTEEGIEKYNLDEYDEETVEKTNPLSGIAVFSTPYEDAYITEHINSDDEEREDFEIKPDDNLVVVAKILKGDYTLEVYIYNENDDDWYVHHDYMLDVPPLCLETIRYDPGSDDKKGNLLAVGAMDSTIGIWDLDIVSAISPIVSLKSAKSGKRYRRDGSAQVHSDAVLSLSWNSLTEHILASGSADTTVILWDIEEVKPASVFSYGLGKVQSVEWHTAEASILLSGTLSGNIMLSDCREGKLCKKWSVNSDVERVLWDHFNPFYFFVAANDGMLYYMDTRFDVEIYRRQAHIGEVFGVSQSYQIKGLISSCGADSKLNIWKLSQDGFNLVHSDMFDFGKLHTVRFSPDSASILAVGGEKSDLVRIVSVNKYEPVNIAFGANN